MANPSFIIPVLDMSPHSGHNILTLLDDLQNAEGEVICIFNSPEVFRRLADHPRIDKYAFNKTNAGVSRSWNMGLDLAEGDCALVLNADLHLEPDTPRQLQEYLFHLDKAVVVGPQGSILDYRNMRLLQYYQKGSFDAPMRTHDVSGFLFAIHMERYLAAGLRFDARFSPCFFEEWDMGLQVMQAGGACYAVPVRGFEHAWGMSEAPGDTVINYFGRPMAKKDIVRRNRALFQEKWASVIGRLPG